MLDLILQNTVSALKISDQYDRDTLINQICNYPEVVSIIDTGAVLSRDSNREFAISLDQNIKFSEKNLQGIIYYDVGSDGKNNDQWMIFECASKVHLPRKMSPIPDSEAFVIYDDARTRGSDFKLKSSAVAFLTLGTCLTKDKFMQGAGRLRQLGHDQRIILIGSCEVWNEVYTLEKELNLENISNTASNVLHWIMMNTEQEIERAVLEYLMQGELFAMSKIDQKNNFVNFALI
jgi:hypothetical protein